MIGHTLLQPESDTTACTCHRRFTKRDTLINEGSKQKQSQIHKETLEAVDFRGSTDYNSCVVLSVATDSMWLV